MWKLSILFAAIAVITYYNKDHFIDERLSTPVLKISTGHIKGFIDRSRNGKEIYSYMKIPYAKPPVGKLRFESPQPPDKWTEVLDVKSMGPKCTQIDMVTQQKYGEEDCLFLNVHVPQSNTKKPLPVLVWIYGGVFMYGSTEIFGPKYFADEDVILVTISYRVASFGFLNTGDGVVRGNMGLKDQNMALRWVQENIKFFNGDPSKVTIFGNSAGSSSVHLHMLSAMSKGLFYKAISQSGTAISPFVLTRNPAEQASRLGKQLNCPTDNTKNLVECLKKVDTDTLVNVHYETNDLLHDRIAMFSPTIETIIDSDTFLTDDPMVLLKEGKIISKVPWISGTLSDEGLILSAVISTNETLLKSLENNWNEVVPKFLFYERNDSVSQHVRKQYFGKMKKIGKASNLNKFTMMLSDRSFYWPLSETAKLQSKVAPVYLYYYSHIGDFSLAHMCTLFRGKFHYILEILFDKIAAFVNRHIWGRKHHNYGCCHADEQFIQFNSPFTSEITKQDGVQYKMSKDFVKLWADFAKDETNLNFRGVKWRPVDPVKTPLRYLMIDMSYGIIDEPFETRIKFWRDNYVF